MTSAKTKHDALLDELLKDYTDPKDISLNLSQFVAHKYWLRRWATLECFRAHVVENGAV